MRRSPLACCVRPVWIGVVLALGLWVRFGVGPSLFAMPFVADGSDTRNSGDWPMAGAIDRQPLQAAVARLIVALESTGRPLPAKIVADLQALESQQSNANISQSIQSLLDPLCLVAVHINAESRVHVVASANGSPRLDGTSQANTSQANSSLPLLQEKGWETFLVKVVNEAGVTAALGCRSPQAEPMVVGSSSKPTPPIKVTPSEAARRWLDISTATLEPMRTTLSGLGLEYRLIQLYSRDAGKREATLQFDVGQGTQDLGFRNEIPLLFECRPSIEIPLRIRDVDGTPTFCSFLICDQQHRVYPHPARRLAPDFFFHHQIYRGDGETISLAPGKYSIVVNRGPEYRPLTFDYQVAVNEPVKPLDVALERWVHMAQWGWISGDHHVHAAGCSHYDNPTAGVTPSDMLRHIVGEDLNVGCVLSWGPCWYVQKQYFEGSTSKLSLPRHLMRYDVEVSGFPSSHAGHLCLLNLREDDFPGTTTIDEWPSWTLPVLQWGKQQGGVVGYSHSGWGLQLPDYLPNGKRGLYPRTNGGTSSEAESRAADQLPDYAMPPFDGIGANEYIVAAAHDACDFISTVDTPAIWELNIWYHLLNCGARTRISGETDFPCIYGERVGLGRVYVQMPVDQPLEYEPWVHGLRDGRSYVGDGMSHLRGFRVNDVSMGMTGAEGKISQCNLAAPGKVRIVTDVAAMLTPQPTEEGIAIHDKRLDLKPYWHLERARIERSRKVPVELIVNGHAVAKQEIEADGEFRELEWEIEVTQSSWIAIRIFPSLHSNPIFVEVDGAPIRASRASAEWCRRAVDVCWDKKRGQIRESDQVAAAAAYEVARKWYDRVLQETQESASSR